MTTTHRVPTPLVLVGGLLGGTLLGVAARAWMRFVSTHPEFTWSGTIAIVVSFTIHGFTQAVARATRRATERRSAVTCARVVGFIGTLPLFAAAGGIMFPTVIGGSLACYRTDWARWVRVLLAAVALMPIGMVASEMVDGWGWSWRTLGALAGLLAIYGIVVAEERATLAPQPDGWRLPRAARITFTALAALLVIVPAVGGGIV